MTILHRRRQGRQRHGGEASGANGSGLQQPKQEPRPERYAIDLWVPDIQHKEEEPVRHAARWTVRGEDNGILIDRTHVKQATTVKRNQV